MKRSLIVVLLILFSLSSIGEAQRRRRRTTARSRTSTAANPCPTNLNDITACPDTGCGGRLDPNLNLRKNIRTNDQAPVKKDFKDLAALPDPVPGFQIGDTREKLKALGEGQMIKVVAYALVARKGSSETCNCHLTAAKDTDNHIVLVDASLTNPTLAADEPESQTAEFTPQGPIGSPKAGRCELAIANCRSAEPGASSAG